MHRELLVSAWLLSTVVQPHIRVFMHLTSHAASLAVRFRSIFAFHRIRYGVPEHLRNHVPAIKTAQEGLQASPVTPERA